MAFYHDPRLQTQLQYHYLPTTELQQQRKQLQLATNAVSRQHQQQYQGGDGGDDSGQYTDYKKDKKKPHPNGRYCYPWDINFKYNDSYNWRVLEKFHGWKKVQCGGKSSKMLKDGCKYCPPKGRVTAGGTPTYRVAGVEGVDWFASMEEVLRYMKACERKGAAFPSTRGKDEPPINWVGEAMQAEARAAKEEAARGARESAALLLAEQDAGLAAGVDGRQVAAALADWEEQERAEEARTGYMSIFSLAREGDTQVLNVFLEGDSGLLEARKETKHPDAGATPLLCAARAGQLETVRWLLGRGADVGAVDDNGLGALHYAAMRDRSDVAALLLAAGADPLLRDDTEMGYTPLHVCVHYDARGTLAALLADEGAKAGIDTVDFRDGFSPLMLAAVRESKEVAIMLLRAGADVLSKDKYSIPVLLKAYFRHAFDFLEALVAEGGLPLATKFEPRDRHTLACFAARDGRTDLLARLHRQVGLQNIDAHTCCGVGIGHHAAESFNTKTMEWLARDLPAMGTGFNDEAAAAAILTAHAKRWPGMLPLHVAASLGQKAHVELIMTSPALGPLDGRARLLGVKDNYEYTVLEGAACRYKPFVVMGLFLWRLRAKVQAAGDKVPPEGSEKFNRGWAATALLKDRQPEKLEVTEYLLRDWCWYYRKALVAQEQPDSGNPRPFAKWLETAATNADVRAICQAFLAEARALAKNSKLPVAARDAAKKREMEAQDAQARAALRAHKASGGATAELPPPPSVHVNGHTPLPFPLRPPTTTPTSSLAARRPAPPAANTAAAAPRPQSPLLPENMAALTEEELLARALALSREEHAREQERRRMVAQQGEVVMSMRELEAQMQAAGLGYEVEYDEEAVDDDIPTVASTPSVAALAGQPVGGRSVQAPAYSPAAAAAASAFSSPNTHNNHVVSSLFATAPIPAPAPVPSAVMPPGLSLAPIGPPPSLRQQPSPMQPSPQPPARAPTLPGLEACFGGDDDDDADDDEPPTDLTCPIKFMLLVDPVVAMDGHTYSRQGLEEWFQRCRGQGNPITSPLAGHEMADVMIANHNVKARAIAWMENQKAKGREYRLL